MECGENSKSRAPEPLQPVAGSQPAATDAAVGEHIRLEIPSCGDSCWSRLEERQAVEEFYAARGFAPLWTQTGKPLARTIEAIHLLKNAAQSGLTASDYRIPDFHGSDARDLARADLDLTRSILAYVSHAQSGRVPYTRVSRDILYAPHPPDTRSVLTDLAGSRPINETLSSYEPPHAEYKALKRKLAVLLEQRRQAVSIPAGRTLRVSEPLMRDRRVPQLRKRLGLETGNVASTAYDRELSRAVEDFQRQRGLPATGALSRATVEALNSTAGEREIEIVRANMERWRWLPRDLGQTYSILNIPDFTLKVVSDSRVLWKTKVVVGKPSSPTPIFSDTMKYITVNPTWNVPPSIVNNEYLPALRQDPDVLSRMGIRVTRNPDGSIRMFQPPGERNALGRLRFNFPNRFLVYQHDTPDKKLFNQEKRAFSHGCMRIENPADYAAIIFKLTDPARNYSPERLRSLFDDKERHITLGKPFPVHITYQTAFVGDSGKLVIRDDIYGHDAKLMRLLSASNGPDGSVGRGPR